MAGSGRLTTQFERGVTSARPQFNAPFVDIAQGLRPIGQMVGGLIDDARAKEMVKSGTAEGQAAANTQIAGGQPDMNFSLLDEVFAPARVDAAQKAYAATIKTDIDSQEEALRTKFALDPEGYKAATQRMVSGFIQGSPHDMAIDVAAYARGRVSDGLGGITRARVQRDQIENVNAVKTRVGRLESDLLADAGTYGTAQWEAKFGEWKAANVDMANNPLFSWTPEQALAAEDKLLEGVQTELAVQGSLADYTANGGGLKGRIAALRFAGRALGFDSPELDAAYAPKGSVTYTAPLNLPVGDAYGAPRPSGPHNGQDIPAPLGTPVSSIGPGKVIAVGENAKSGKFVRILHPDGRISAYGHLSEQGVKEGDEITPGATLGKVGNTGDSSGPHLHIVVRDRDGRTVDPQSVYGTEAAPALAGAAPEAQAPPVDSPLADLAPDRRRKIWTRVKSEINAFSAADIEQARLDNQIEQEARQAERQTYDRHRLAIQAGESDGSWKSDPTIPDGLKASLYTAENTARSRERSEAARDVREEKAEKRSTYLKYDTLARDGLLTDAQLAEAVESGEINKAERQNLLDLRNKKGLRFDVDIMTQGAGTFMVKAPPGMNKGDYASLKSRWLTAARDWRARNPEADDARMRLAGENILKALRPTTAPAPKPGAEGRSKTARINAIRRGRPVTALSAKEKADIAAITREP